MTATGQLAFKLPHRTAMSREDFLVSSSNSLALAALDAWAGWPRGRFALTGERRSGKTHLVHVWAEMTGARVMNARDLREADLTA
ncbi:MAG: chromosomal replication initiator DnaA, partial [Pseudomonadota bacterium]